MAFSKLSIRLLGELSVQHDGEAVPLPASKKARALLGYLVATRRVHTRERLCDLLWSTPDDPRAQLRWCLWKLRPLVDHARTKRLVAARDRAGFEAHGAEIDVARIGALLGGGVGAASLEALREATALFRGDLLEGLDLSDCYRFQEWLVGEREAFRLQRLSVLAALAARLRDEAPEEALGYARARLALDPLAEEGHIAAIEVLRALGRTREAMNQYETCKRILASELHARPSADLERARMALTMIANLPPAERASRSVSPSVLSVAARAPAAGSRPEPEEARRGRLFGREAECAILDEPLAALTACVRPPVLLLLGDPGIGKTRMLEELRAGVEARGGRVLRSRAFEAERGRPLGAWIDAVRELPAAELTEIAEPLRSVLAPLFPGASREAPGGARDDDRARLYEAVAALLASLAAGRPLAVVFDDVQWLDEASAGLLHFAARAPACERVLFACAARGGELGDNAPVLRVVRAWTRERRAREIRLLPLDRAATEKLVRSVERDVDAARVFGESEGNPLFALEIARALGSGADRIPETVVELIADRIDRLDDHARELVPWLALWGRSFAPERLPLVTGLSEPSVLAGIEALERHGVLRAQDVQTYDFAHDLIRRAARERVPSPRRRMMHLRIARALAEADGGGARGELAGDIARHAAEGGDAELTARACVAASEHCLRLFAYEEAAAAIDLGCHHVARLPSEARIRLHMRLLKVLEHPGLRRAATRRGAEIARLCSEAGNAGMMSELSSGLHLLGWMHLAGGDFRSARKTALRALEALRQRGEKDVSGLVEGARCLAILDLDLPRASAMFADLAAFGDEVAETISFQWGLGLVKQWEGDVEGARTALHKACALARHTGDHWAEFECLSALVMVDLEEGKADAALALAGALSPLAAKLGGGSEGAFADALVALARLASGEDDEGAHRAVDEAAAALQRLDATFPLAYALNGAAELDIARRNPARARVRAQRALAAATAVDRASEIVRAHALLVEASILGEARDEAHAHLASARAVPSQRLSARARRALERAGAAVC